MTNKQYEVFHVIRRDGGFGQNYTDHHTLFCLIKKEGTDDSYTPTMYKKVPLSTCTRNGGYTEADKPYVDDKTIEHLAKSVAKDFPFKEGDIVITHNYNSFLNVAQFPLDERLLKLFQEHLERKLYKF